MGGNSVFVRKKSDRLFSVPNHHVSEVRIRHRSGVDQSRQNQPGEYIIATEHSAVPCISHALAGD